MYPIYPVKYFNISVMGQQKILYIHSWCPFNDPNGVRDPTFSLVPP